MADPAVEIWSWTLPPPIEVNICPASHGDVLGADGCETTYVPLGAAGAAGSAVSVPDVQSHKSYHARC